MNPKLYRPRNPATRFDGNPFTQKNTITNNGKQSRKNSAKKTRKSNRNSRLAKIRSGQNKSVSINKPYPNPNFNPIMTIPPPPY